MLISKSTDTEDDGKCSAHTSPEQIVEELQADLHRALCIVEALKLELETALKERDQVRSQLEEEQHDSQLLHSIGEMLIDKHNTDALYQKLLDAATEIMHSDLGSLQRYDSERNELQLIAHSDLDDEAIAFWQWVCSGQATTCGQALKKSQRVPAATSPVALPTTKVEFKGDHANGQTARILNVDDNADSAQSLSMVLDGLGHLTRVILDSREAVAATLDFKLDVAILDIGMPCLN